MGVAGDVETASVGKRLQVADDGVGEVNLAMALALHVAVDPHPVGHQSGASLHHDVAFHHRAVEPARGLRGHFQVVDRLGADAARAHALVGMRRRRQGQPPATSSALMMVIRVMSLRSLWPALVPAAHNVPRSHEGPMSEA